MQTSLKSKAHRSSMHKPPRKRGWDGLTNAQILALYPAGSTAPLTVLEVLIQLFNAQHTAKQKSVSFKTRHERANFLRRFFRVLQKRGGLARLPDPRNLNHRHIEAMVQLWKEDKLAAGTIQTYLSFLRGFAIWIGKRGLVKRPEDYGLAVDEYQRHQASNADKSWSGNHVDVQATLAGIAQYDKHVGAMMALIRAFGLRKKEAVMLRPFLCVVPFEGTGLPPDGKQANRYLAIVAGSKGGRQRYIPLNTPERIAAVEQAQRTVARRDCHMGQPGYSLKQSLRRFTYVMEKFGVTQKSLGVTAHGLRHEALIAQYEALTGLPAPVRGGKPPPKPIESAARGEVAVLAGHNRARSSSAYLGSIRLRAADKPEATEQE